VALYRRQFTTHFGEDLGYGRAMSNASKIVAAFQQAMGGGDFIAARQLLRDDLSFRGPIGTFDSADALMEVLKSSKTSSSGWM